MSVLPQPVLGALQAFKQFPVKAKALVVLGVIIGVALLTVYLVSAFTPAASIAAKRSLVFGNEQATYRWDGTQVLLLDASDRARASCAVRPDDGAERHLGVIRTRWYKKDPLVRPWFSGPATVACETYVNEFTTVSVYLGGWAHVRKWMTGPNHRLVAVGLVAAPIGTGIMIGMRAGVRRRFGER